MATAAATAACSLHQRAIAPPIHLLPQHHSTRPATLTRKAARITTKCNRSLGDFIGGDLLKLDLGQWLADVEEHKALAIYSPHEGGYEGRYLIRLAHQGYHFLDLSARGLGDPETTLTKFHPVCPVSRQFGQTDNSSILESVLIMFCLFILSINFNWNMCSLILGSSR